MLSFAFVAVLAVSWLLVRSSGRKLTVSRTIRPERPTAGDRALVSVSVRNGSPLPGPQVTVAGGGGALGLRRPEMEFESLEPRGEKTMTGASLPVHRGVHRLPALRLQAEDPLGLVRRRRDAGGEQELVVYPRLVELGACELVTGSGRPREWGESGALQPGSSEFRGIRPHAPGEPLGRVDWKATAKTGSLMLREMDDPTNSDYFVLLDGTAAALVGTYPDTNFELAVSVAGSLAGCALRAGRGVDLALHDRAGRQARLVPGPHTYRRLLETLATAQPDATSPLGHTLKRLQTRRTFRLRGASLALVTLTLDRDLVHNLIALHERGVRLSVLHIDGASFAGADGEHPGAAAETAWESRRALLLSLAAAGVLCLTVRHGDDLRTVLSPRRERDREDSA